MAIPDRQDFMLPILKIVGDGNEHSNHEVYEILAKQFGLNETDRKERIPSDRDRIFDNRVRFELTNLRKALVLLRPGRVKFGINERSMNVLKENPSHIDYEFLRRFPEYLDYIRRKSPKN